MTGCTWVVGHIRKWNRDKKQYDKVAVHCGKLPDNDSVFCPKHKLYAKELGEQQHNVKTGDHY